MTEALSLPLAATRLSAVAARLSAALADEAADPLAPLTHLDRTLDLVELLSWGMCREPATFPVGGLREIARDLIGEDAPAVGRGCEGLRGGQPAEVFADELAGVILGAAVLAETAAVDLDAAITRQAAALGAARAPVPVSGGSGD
jgi:hypothetical protein